MCQGGEPIGCLQTAQMFDRIRSTGRFGTTSAALRERATAMAAEACKTGNGGPCFRYGKALLENKYLKADSERGLAAITQACQLGAGDACAFLADAHQRGDRVRKNPKRARELITRACDTGSAEGCYQVAVSIAKLEPARAQALFVQACAGRSAAACIRAGAAHRSAGAIDPAIMALLAACDLGEDASCADAAALIEGGKGSLRDPQQARALYTMACHGRVAGGCAGLAAMIVAGTGGPRDWGAGIDMFAQACDLGDRGACRRGPELAKTPPDATCSTIDQCKTYCAERIVKSCTQLGRLLGAASGGDCSAAVGAYRDACDGGDPSACVLVGNAARQTALIGDWYARACKAKDANACLLDAVYVAFGGSPAAEPAISPQRRKRARAQLEQACARDVEACAYHATAVSDENAARGRELLTAACGRGSKRACRLLDPKAAPAGAPCNFVEPEWLGSYWR